GAQSNTMTIDLSLATTGTWTVPFPDGRAVYDPQEWVVVLYYEDLIVPAGKTVRFRNHGSRAPVAMLATNSLTIEGTIDVSGESGDSANGPPRYAEPGPGGFRGARGTLFPTANDTSSGFGPGGGLRNTAAGSWMGNGAGHGTVGVVGVPSANPPGAAYGQHTLTRLVGGSGGGGALAAR
ncbi:MAG: hypothetical protein NTY35_07400, partial [Planctomycetota bacterium]|nr:hypothetical protein [Planctomycetota bacterium]